MPIHLLRLCRLVSLAAAASIFVVAAGCKSSPEEPDDFARSAIFAPPTPPFLSGAMSVFLTNAAGYSARVSASGFAVDPAKEFTGQLFGAGKMLLFVIDPKSGGGGDSDPGFSFLWDVSAGKGQLLCEALQGFAPISTATTFVEVGQASAPAPQMAGTRQVVETTHTFRLGNNSTNVVQVLRDEQGFPLRLTSMSPAENATVSLSRVRFGGQAAELFAVPEGFTPYSSAEDLVDELAARKRELRRKRPIENPLLLEN